MRSYSHRLRRLLKKRRECIGRQLSEAREAKGYTLRYLAKLTGIAYNHIGRIEQGRYNVTVDTLFNYLLLQKC